MVLGKKSCHFEWKELSYISELAHLVQPVIIFSALDKSFDLKAD